MDPLPPDAEKVAALRAALPATGAGIYLDTATAGPLPAETAVAMREADEWELRVGRAAAGREEDTAQRAAEARAVLAALIGADADQVALFAGVDLALAAAALGLGLRSGDEVLATSLDGPGVLAVLAGLRAALGTDARVVSVPLAAPPAEVVELVGGAISPRTRLLVTSCVSPLSGTVLPIGELADAVRANGGWLVADASQAAGAVAFSAPQSDADLVAFAADTWPLGPEGTAALWVGPRAATGVRPPLGGRDAFETLSGEVATPWPDARRFEPGGLGRTTLLGLARSVGWLEMYVGLDWALARAARLARDLRRRLAAIPGVELLTPEQAMATIVTFRVDRWAVSEAADELGRRIFAITRPLSEIEAIRASVAWFNTEDELERFAAAVGELAAHTPATLPRRPSLIVLPSGDPAGDRR